MLELHPENPPILTTSDNIHFRLEGKLLFNTITPFYQEAENVFSNCQANAYNEVTIDLSGVTNMDSAGVALLVYWTRILHHKGKKILIANPSEQLLSLIELSDLQGILTISEHQYSL